MGGSILHKIRIRITYYSNSVLYWYFHFDKWHRSPYIGRPYAIKITEYLNLLKNRGTIVEIGCGLGGILRHVDFKNRRGFDIDRNALRAAGFLSKVYRTSIYFEYFEFPLSDFSKSTDVIIMVNWIHNVPPSILQAHINKYFNQNLLGGGVLIIDTVRGKNYKYHHDINQLTSGLSCSVKRIYHDDIVGREVFIIVKISDTIIDSE